MRIAFCAALLACGAIALPSTAEAGGRTGARKTLKWQAFLPKGLGIHVTKPTTLKMKKRPAKAGYLAFGGTDSVTGTRFALYVRKAGLTAVQLKAHLNKLTGVASDKWLPLMSVGAVRGFKWQQTLLHRRTNGMTTGVLLGRHGKRALSYVLVVQVHAGVGMKYLADFKKAYFGLKAVK